jgi:hypothetical protein
MVEHAVMKSDSVITVSSTAMTDGAGDELAKRLNIEP